MSGPSFPHEKACPQCGRILPDTEFHRNKRRPDGLSFYCKSCAAERSEKSRRKRGVAPKKRAASTVPPGLKWCPDCNQIKPLEDFARTKRSASGVHSYCKPCHNARGKETVERLYGTSRHYHLTRRYGVGEKEFAELLAEQGGVCANAARPVRNTWTTIIAPDGCAGYSASTATVVLGSSATTRAI